MEIKESNIFSLSFGGKYDGTTFLKVLIVKIDLYPCSPPGPFFTVYFLYLFQTHVHKNISDKLSKAILVLLDFHGWYVGLRRLEVLYEFGGVKWLFSFLFYFLFGV